MQKDDDWCTVSARCASAIAAYSFIRVNGKVVDIKGDPDCPNSRGKICSKAYSAIMHLYDPNRVSTPLSAQIP